MPNRLFRARDIIFKEGAAPDGVYYICTGKVRVTRLVGGEETTLAELEPGDVFGELAMVDNRPRSATISAVEDTWVYHFTPQAFSKKMQEMDKFMYEVFNTLVLTIRNLNLKQDELVRSHHDHSAEE